MRYSGIHMVIWNLEALQDLMEKSIDKVDEVAKGVQGLSSSSEKDYLNILASDLEDSVYNYVSARKHLVKEQNVSHYDDKMAGVSQDFRALPHFFSK